MAESTDARLERARAMLVVIDRKLFRPVLDPKHMRVLTAKRDYLVRSIDRLTAKHGSR